MIQLKIVLDNGGGELDSVIVDSNADDCITFRDLAAEHNWMLTAGDTIRIYEVER